MKLWKENNINQKWELDNKEIANRFIVSKYFKDRYELYRGTEHALVWFIGAKDGLNSTWEWDNKKGSVDGSKDMLQILDLIDEKCKK